MVPADKMGQTNDKRERVTERGAEGRTAGQKHSTRQTSKAQRVKADAVEDMKLVMIVVIKYKSPYFVRSQVFLPPFHQIDNPDPAAMSIRMHLRQPTAATPGDTGLCPF